MKLNNRIDLAKYFNELGFKVGAEIGVADGRYSEILCQSIPSLTLFCIDPWAPYGGNWRSQKYQSKAYQKAREKLKEYDVEFITSTSVDAYTGKGFIDDVVPVEDNSLDFVFIDGAHDFDNVMLDIILWTRKVKKGGIISGHDYYPAGTVKVMPAVDAYCEAHGIKPNIIPRFEGGHKDDQAPCWWWVKP